MDLGMAQLADGFARVIGDVPPDRLEGFMRTPPRRPLLDAVFWERSQHPDSSLTPPPGPVRWRITGLHATDADVYDLSISGGRCRVSRDQTAAEPQVTITVDR